MSISSTGKTVVVVGARFAVEENCDMSEPPISDNPSLRNLRDNANNFTNFKKVWPLLRPLFKMLGSDVAGVDNALKKGDQIVAQTEEWISVPDNFNDLFADKGWIIYSRMNNDIAIKAIELGKLGQFDDAEKMLVEYYSPEQIEFELRTMIAVEAFRSRMPLAKKALADFKEGRYYSTVLVVLSLLDGMVNEIQQKGFFAQEVDLTAWDSIAAHSKGLQKLTSILSRTRKKTRTETISIPYRHGIMHGMDLGYDNKVVAVKSWLALFATRDWAVKAERNQLEAPPPKPEKTWKELLEQLRDIEKDKKALAAWKPRNLEIGKDVLISGEVIDYEGNSPEQKLAEFLNYWKSNNYGYMAKCVSRQIGHPAKELPMRVREEYSYRRLKSWMFYQIQDESPAVTVIIISAVYDENGLTNTKLLEARLICEDDQNFGVVRGKPGSRWALVTWYLRAVDIE